MTENKKKTEYIRIRINEEMKKSIQELATREDEKISQIVRKALKEWLAKYSLQNSRPVIKKRP